MFDFADFSIDASIPENAEFSGGPYIPDAAECMRCGMCVSHCPTFRLTQIDAETPRQRIRTLSKLLVEDAPPNAQELFHLDNCLQCRACEAVCPSRMPYSALFEQALAQRPPKLGRLARLAFYLIEHKRWRYALLPIVRLYAKLFENTPRHDLKFWRLFGLDSAAAALQAPALGALPGFFPAAAKRGTVALFTGCLAEHLDRLALEAAVKLLNAIGYNVIAPPEQSCCGALHQHAGLSAAALQAQNQAVFNALDVDAVLHAASGCGAVLSEYPGDGEAERRFRDRLQDAAEFIAAHWPDDLTLKPLAQTVAVHEPCSQRNVLKNQQAVYDLLAKIPQLQVQALAGNNLCCGAGGAYFLTHPENAAALRDIKQEHMQASGADCIVSANYGCATWLQTEALPVIHPLLLLSRQL